MPAVVIVTYQSRDVLGPCLESLDAAEGAAEVIVVDNASGDGSADLAERHPGVTVIRNPDNRGFAAAVAQGVAASHEDPIVLLNPDTEVAPDCLVRLAAALEDDAVAIAGCKVLDGSGQTIQHAGGVVEPNGLTHHLGRGEADRGQHDERCDVDYVTGAGLAIRRSRWDELNGFDPGYWPAYYEECELCWRARAAGYRVVYEPGAVLRHHEAASTRQDDGTLSGNFYNAYHRNRLRFVLRNFTLADMCLRFLPAELHAATHDRYRGHGRALVRAYGATALRLPSLLRYRLTSR